MTDDEGWMRQALTLAERGRGAVEPNPLVGAVVVRDGRCVGQGWHEQFGGPHAEVNALTETGVPARGSTLYVTLEPCCHHGKTPPCVGAILQAGIARVVVAMPDPFPAVSGQGIQQLRAAGVAVDVGLCQSEAESLNRPYLTLLRKERPYVHCKWAMTLDGKLASRSGDSKWISNESSRRIVHRLRSRMDAIVIGAGTLRADDPLLTVRPPGPRIPTRIVVSTQPYLPLDSQLVRTLAEASVILATANPQPPQDCTPLPSSATAGANGGCDFTPPVSSSTANAYETIHLPTINNLISLPALLADLSRRRMTNILVEGGAALLGSFLDARLIDEVHVFIAPKLLGGRAALSPLAGQGIAHLTDAIGLQDMTVTPLENDVYIRGTL